MKINNPSYLYLMPFAYFATTRQTFAAGQDFTSLSSAVDFSTVQSAIMAVAIAVVTALVVHRGAKYVIGFVEDKKAEREMLDDMDRNNRE